MLEMTQNPASLRAPLTCLIVDDSAFMRFHLLQVAKESTIMIAQLSVMIEHPYMYVGGLTYHGSDIGCTAS